MKMNIEIDCTPQEARSFLGLPDLSALHGVYLDRMQELMREGVSSADMEKMMRQWMPNLTTGWEQWQKALWTAAASPAPDASKP